MWLTKMLADWKAEKGIEFKLITPAESVSSQLKVVDELTMEKTGLFLNYTGEEWDMKHFCRDN